ncbi:MAG: hypothetical protein ACOYYS_14455 [Chloroflexota bacterium]
MNDLVQQQAGERKMAQPGAQAKQPNRFHRVIARKQPARQVDQHCGVEQGIEQRQQEVLRDDAVQVECAARLALCGENVVSTLQARYCR